MFNQFSEQVKKSSQPANDLFAANVKAMQDVAAQHTLLVSGVLNDSIKLIKTASEQTELKGLLAAQSVYAESMRERVTSSSKSTYGVLNAVGQQFTSALKANLSQTTEAAKKVQTDLTAQATAKAAPVKATTVNATPAKAKKAPTKKAAPKKATVAKPAPSAKKAAAKPAVKVAPTVPKTAAKPAAKKPVTKKATAQKAAPKADSKAASKAKPVPKLSAENVRAVAKAPTKTAAPKKSAAKKPATVKSSEVTTTAAKK
jgi:phasin family protein